MDCETNGSLMVNDPADRGKMDEIRTSNCRTRSLDRHNIQRKLSSSDCEEHQDEQQLSIPAGSENKGKMTKTPPDVNNNVNGRVSREEGELVDDEDSDEDGENDVDDDVDGLSVANYGWVSLCGRRRAIEDAVAVVPGLLKYRSKRSGERTLSVCDFFGVYDGHGGSAVAHVCRDRLHEVIAEEMETEMRRRRDDGNFDWEKVMERGFGRVDEEIRERGVEVESMNLIGSTAVVALVTPERLVVANCGDSRAVLSRGGAAVPLSHDHKPDRPDEMERVEAAGGRVVNWYGYRILGVLATSRSIGDQYLKPYVISVPEVTVKERSEEEDEFLILASDGLWDVMSNEVACKMVRKCLEYARLRNSAKEDDAAESSGSSYSCCSSSRESGAAEAAAMLAELALARGSKDNITAVVVELLNNSR